MWSPLVPAPSVIPRGPRRCVGCAAAAPRSAWAWPVPLPLARAAGTAPGAWESQMPNLERPPVPSGRLGVLTPLPSLSRWAVPRAHGPKREPSADKTSGQALPVPPGPAGLESCAWPVSIYCLHMCRPLGPLACCLCPQARCHHPQQANQDPARTTVGPSLHSWSRPLCPPPHPAPPRSGPGLERTRACPASPFLTGK